jgi:hypothetical protein
MPWTLKFWNSNPTPPAPTVTWNYGTGVTPSDVPAVQVTGITVTVHWDYGDSALISRDYGDSALISRPTSVTGRL